MFWQQQMKTVYIERYNKIHILKQESGTHNETAKSIFSTPFRSLPEIQENESQLIDPPTVSTSSMLR